MQQPMVGRKNIEPDEPGAALLPQLAHPSSPKTFHSVIVPTIYKEMFIIVATIYRLIFSTIFNNILKSITASRSFPLQERCSPQSSRRPDTRENF